MSDSSRLEAGLPPFNFTEAVEQAGLEDAAERLADIGLVGLQGEEGRVDRWVLQPEGLGWRFDFTKQLLDDAAWDSLVQLAELADWQGARDLQFSGAAVNETEGRAVLHMALRGQSEDAF